MNENSPAILQKLDLLDPIYGRLSETKEVYQPDEETREIWNSIRSYVEILALNLTDLLEGSASTEVISSMSHATVMLSSMVDIIFQLHAKRNSLHPSTTRKRMMWRMRPSQGSSASKATSLAIDMTETKIKQAIEVIQHHNQIVQTKAHVKEELTTTQEVMTHHLNKLVDSLVAYYTITLSLSTSAIAGLRVNGNHNPMLPPSSAPLPTKSTPTFYNTVNLDKLPVGQFTGFYKKRYSRSATCLFREAQNNKFREENSLTHAVQYFDSPSLQRDTAIGSDPTSGDSNQKFNIKSIKSHPSLSASTVLLPGKSIAAVEVRQRQSLPDDKGTTLSTSKRLFSLTNSVNYKSHPHQSKGLSPLFSSGYLESKSLQFLQKRRVLMERMPFSTVTTDKGQGTLFSNYPVSLPHSTTSSHFSGSNTMFSCKAPSHYDAAKHPFDNHGRTMHHDMVSSTDQHGRHSSTDNDSGKIEITDKDNINLKPILNMNDPKLPSSLPTIESFLSMLTQNDNADNLSLVSADGSDNSSTGSLTKIPALEHDKSIQPSIHRQDSNSPPPPPPVPPKDHLFYILQQSHVAPPPPPPQSNTSYALYPQQLQQRNRIFKTRSPTAVEGSSVITNSSEQLTDKHFNEQPCRRYTSNRNRSNTYLTSSTTTTTTTATVQSNTGTMGGSHSRATLRQLNTAATVRTIIPPRRSSMPTPVPKSLTEGGHSKPSLPNDAKDKVSKIHNRNRKNSVPLSIFSGDDSPRAFLEKFHRTDPQPKKEESTKPKLGKSLVTLTSSISSDLLSKKKDKQNNGTRLIRVMDQDKIVLLYEMVGDQNKLQVIAGTKEKLFEKLADETAQDDEYVETYIRHYKNFMSPKDFLKRLIKRFRLRPLPGEYEHFKKWKLPIQIRVLHIIETWVTLQYIDFEENPDVRSEAMEFLHKEHNSAHMSLKEQMTSILCALETNKVLHCSKHQVQLELFYQIINEQQQSDPSSSNNNSKLIQPAGNHFNFHLPFIHTTTATADEVYKMPPLPSIKLSTELDTFLSMESKDIAKYLTLADYYLFKCIIYSNELIQMRDTKNKSIPTFIDFLTKRANMISHWVVHEILKVSCTKSRKQLLKKFIEIAKACLDYNNFHTCMVIILGLNSTSKLKDTMSMLTNKDTATFNSLSKLLTVDMNMRHYRKKIRLSSLAPYPSSNTPTMTANKTAAAAANTIKIPFLPVVLKDQTFFQENTNHHQHQQLTTTTHLINFSKYSSIQRFIHRLKLSVSDSYPFSRELSIYPFMPFSTTRLDKLYTKDAYSPNYRGLPPSPPHLNYVAGYIERCINQVKECYAQCDLLTTVQ